MLRYANPGWIHYGLIIEFCKGYLHASPAQRLLNPPTPFSVHFLHQPFFCTFGCTPWILASNMIHFHSPISCLNCKQAEGKEGEDTIFGKCRDQLWGIVLPAIPTSRLPPCRSLHTPSNRSHFHAIIEWFLGTLGNICNQCATKSRHVDNLRNYIWNGQCLSKCPASICLPLSPEVLVPSCSDPLFYSHIPLSTKSERQSILLNCVYPIHK